ncbi:MAG: YceI family protein [Bacteroidales bacterium]
MYFNKILNTKALVTHVIMAITMVLAMNVTAGDHSSSLTRFTSTDVNISVVGTSTLHDWEMQSDAAVSEAQFTVDNQGQPERLESVMFRLQKNTLKSDKSGLDRRAYDAMNADRHPEIIFRTNGSGDLQESGDKYEVNTKGELTVAGVTRNIDVNATCTNGNGNELVCTGSQTLNMSDFDIDPPVMMLGTLRTGDEITINYRIVYSN